MKSQTSIQHITRKKPFRGNRQVKVPAPAKAPAFSVPSKFDLVNLEKAFQGHREMAIHHANAATELHAAGNPLLKDDAGHDVDGAAQHEAMASTHISAAASVAAKAVALHEGFVAFHQKLHQTAAKNGNVRSMQQQAGIVAGHQDAIAKLKSTAPIGVPRAAETKHDAS